MGTTRGSHLKRRICQDCFRQRRGALHVAQINDEPAVLEQAVVLALADRERYHPCAVARMGQVLGCRLHGRVEAVRAVFLRRVGLMETPAGASVHRDRLRGGRTAYNCGCSRRGSGKNERTTCQRTLHRRNIHAVINGEHRTRKGGGILASPSVHQSPDGPSSRKSSAKANGFLLLSTDQVPALPFPGKNLNLSELPLPQFRCSTMGSPCQGVRAG